VNSNKGMTFKEKKDRGMEYLCRIENNRGRGWLFRAARATDKYHAEFFSDSGRLPNVSLEEARTYRNDYLAKHPQPKTVRLPVYLRLPKNNRSGILGVNYTERILPSGTRSTQWEMTCPSPESGSRKPKRKCFSILEFGETQALIMAVQARRDATMELLRVNKNPQAVLSLQQLVGDYDDIISELKQRPANGNDSELLAIIRKSNLDATSKQREILARLGQHRFRRLVLTRWNDRCAVTGADIFVEAAHIKPWHASTDFERENPGGGIALSLLYHRAFDLGYISFTDEGSILVSESMRKKLLHIGLNLSVHISHLTDSHRSYLQHHRQKFFSAP
jgi:hypothetical protein